MLVYAGGDYTRASPMEVIAFAKLAAIAGVMMCTALLAGFLHYGLAIFYY